MLGSRLLRVALALFALLGLFAVGAFTLRHELGRRALGLPSFTSSLGGRELLFVTTRDGVRLATHVIKPAGDGPFPALLMRSPYPDIRPLLTYQCELYARYGYACVLQESRGRGGSEGEWIPFLHERDDGIDALRWLVAEHWTDGNVALIGASYLGFTQWVLADALPPDVRTIVPAVVSTKRRATMYERGMFRSDLYTSWTVGNSGRETELSPSEQFWGAVRHRPALEADVRFLGGELPWYREWLSHPEPDAKLWSEGVWAKLESVPERTAVPVLMIAGWYDHNLAGTFEAFDRLRSRWRSLLVVGPWLHTFQSAGRDLPSGIAYTAQLQLRWLEHQLKGEPSGEPAEGVFAFVMGEGFRSFPSWPPPSQSLQWHLAAPSVGACFGALVEGAPPAPATLAYRYDPDDPVPTQGGEALLGWAAGVDAPSPGRVEQDPPCARPDVLSFLSEPLAEDLVVIGRPRVHLEVASSAEDSAFSVKLIEVDGRGRATNVRDSIASLAYADGAGPRAYTPGSVVPLDFTLWPIAIRLPAGSRLRLDVSSSNFPAYHAHPNRAGPWAEQREARVATQTLALGGAWLKLPVVR
jgi:hypothetical protein